MAKPTIGMLLAAAALVAGCEHDLPETPRGAEIEGVVTYAGGEGDAFSEPVLQVAAFSNWPPVGPPYAATEVAGPDLSGQSYRLSRLPGTDFHVVARLFDGRSTGGPLGAFPTFCALGQRPSGSVLTGDGVVSDVDIVLYDGMGATDPCNALIDDICPKPGSASVVFDVFLPTLATNDSLVFGLFPSWPPTGPPVESGLLDDSQLDQEFRYTRNDLPPGDWVLYLCLDRGSNSLTSICDESEDSFVVLGATSPIALTSDTITTLSIDLVNGEVDNQEVVSSQEAGCTGGGTGLLTATIVGEGITLDDDDNLALLAFANFPIDRPPVGIAEANADRELPITLTIELDEGTYFPAVCLDRQGDNFGCDGEGDLFSFYMDGSESIDVRAGDERTLELRLDESPVGPASIEVTVTSTTVTPEPGDRLSAAIFDSFPPPGPPTAFAFANFEAIPTLLTIMDVTPGDWFVSVCLDRGGDNIICDGPGDQEIAWMDGEEALTVRPGTTETITVEIP